MNIISPSIAIQLLKEGNKRFVDGIDEPDSFQHQSSCMANDQNPYACILGCADSRVSPEHAFDESHGHLFVTRVAGNFVTPEIIASLEYGTNVLGASVIMVLGHSNCGAINAAIKAKSTHIEFPGHIDTILTALNPVIEQAHDEDAKKWARKAVERNVIHNVQLLRNAPPILTTRIKDGVLKIIGGIYDLNTGKVEILEQ